MERLVACLRAVHARSSATARSSASAAASTRRSWLALAVRAFGAERVVALLLPEKDSDPESERLAREVARPLRGRADAGGHHRGAGGLRLLSAA